MLRILCVKRIMLAVTMLCGLLLNSSVLAQVALESIGFNEVSDGKFEIQLNFDAPPPEPEVFEVANPARLSMDFDNVSSNLEERRYPLQFEAADSVMVLESQGRTRMVVNLVEAADYSSRVEGNSMFIVVGNEPTAAASQSATLSDSDIISVQFRLAQDGSGQIIVNLASDELNGNLDRRGEKLQLEFPNSVLDSALQERLDVTDFGTSVRYIDVYSERGSVMIVADVAGEFEFIGYQGNQEYIINITPFVPESVAVVENGPDYDFSGDTISLDYPNIPIRDALQLLAKFNDFNLVMSTSVGGNTTLRLENVPWEQALDNVLRSGGLDKRMEGNVMYVAPSDEIVASELAALQNLQQQEILAPLHTEYIEVNYAVASEMAVFLSGADTGGGILSDRGSVSVDARTNTLIVKDVAPVLADVREMLTQLDIPVRQVLIEARIVTAETTFSKDLGVRWAGVQQFGNTFTLGGTLGAVGIGEGILPASSLMVDLGAAGASSSIALGYAGSDGMLALELSALEDSGNGEVIAQPKVTTQDQQLARIESGLQIPYQAQAGGTAGGSTTEFVDAVLSLEVTPQITPDGRIIMLLDIHQDKAVPNANGGVPAIATNVVTTRVLVDNGDTIVLGGVFKEEEVTATSKTVLLGDLPYIGGLFRRTLKQNSKTELLIFITPSIINE